MAYRTVVEKHYGENNSIGMNEDIAKLKKAGIPFSVLDDRGGSGCFVIVVEYTKDYEDKSSSEVTRTTIAKAIGRNQFKFDWTERNAAGTLAI